MPKVRFCCRSISRSSHLILVRSTLCYIDITSMSAGRTLASALRAGLSAGPSRCTRCVVPATRWPGVPTPLTLVRTLSTTQRRLAEVSAGPPLSQTNSELAKLDLLLLADLVSGAEITLRRFWKTVHIKEEEGECSMCSAIVAE